MSTPDDVDRWKWLDARHHDLEAERYDDLIGREFAVYQDDFTAGRWAQRLADAGARLVLDIGCGTGRTALDVARAGSPVIGIDMSRGMLRRAREKARRRGLTNILLVAGDAEALPVPDGAADGIVCQGVLHHLPNVRAALSEADRTASESALLFLAEPDAEASAVYRAVHGGAALLGRLVRTARRLGSPGALNERPLEPDEILGPLEEMGWVPKAAYLVHVPFVYRFVPQGIARSIARAINSGDLSLRRPADILIVEARRRPS